MKIVHRQYFLCCLLLVVLILSVGSVSGAGGSGDTVAATNGTNSSKTHKLVITTSGKPASYSFAVSGRLNAKTTEPIDSVQGQGVSGRVGGVPWKNSTNDTKDVIHFTGEITDFQADKGIRLRLDERRTNPMRLRRTPEPTPTQKQPSSSTLTPTSTPSSVPTTSSDMPSTTSQTSQNETSATAQSDSGGASMILAGFVGGMVVAGGFVLLFARHL